VLELKLLNWLVQSRRLSAAYLPVTLHETPFRRQIQAQRKMGRLFDHAIVVLTCLHGPLPEQVQPASLS
jgi:hypothetical protein